MAGFFFMLYTLRQSRNNNILTYAQTRDSGRSSKNKTSKDTKYRLIKDILRKQDALMNSVLCK